ncbi:MAG: aminotransferase class I/II-fold pyridoxal phosphate-dependent enzyme, partial [Desulfobulbaceae bacterium]|nr:aminotransferase class I/II-fold pyridoxal phosphate-dependent enzyme [Desulfobulbaceae bacterium]
MFESLQPMPADAILGLIVEHRNDPRPEKIDLGVGVYRDADGQTPVLGTVKRAEKQLLETQTSKTYIGTAGDPLFNASMQALTFAGAVPDERLVTIQTPGGSGSLRVAAGIILRARKNPTLWVSAPTWANHVPLLGSAGLTLKEYPYYDSDRQVIKVNEMLEGLRAAPKGDLVLFHACCHNPSGLDPSEDEWRAITDVVVERDLVPFIDIAYQGFAQNLDDDAFAIRHLASHVPEMLVTSSSSKNFGLYRDRVGTLSILTDGPSSLPAMAS